MIPSLHSVSVSAISPVADPTSDTTPMSFLTRPHGAGSHYHRYPNTNHGLRLATHNVSGLTSVDRIFELVDAWHARHLDIICLQETWIGHSGSLSPARSETQVEQWLYAAAQNCGASPYRVFWASNTTMIDERNGMAILLRQSEDIQVSAPIASPCRRLLCLNVRWAGHNFTLVNTYCPAQSPVSRAQFLDTVLRPVL